MRRLSIPLLVLVLVAAACSGESEEATTTSDPGVTTTLAPTTTEVEATTTTEPATTTTAQESSGAQCLTGTWILDNEAFVENFESIFADAGMPDAEVTPLEGSFTVELAADGSLTATRVGWGFNVATGEGTIILEIDGTETGTWSADDSTLTVDTDTSDLELSAAVEVDGEIIDMPSEFQPDFDVPPGVASDSAYTCSADVLTLTNDGVESVLNRA